VVALEVWFDQAPDNDFGPGDPATIVASVDELEAMIAHVLAATATYEVPAMVQANLVDSAGYPVVEAGIGPQRGFIGLMDRTGAYYSVGDVTLRGEVTYDYMGQVRGVPASAEIPLAEVRQWLVDFIATGRPSATVPLRGVQT
jgi:hypothetical protein